MAWSKLVNDCLLPNEEKFDMYQKLSKFNSESANRLDIPKSGPNLVSDQKTDFSQNW